MNSSMASALTRVPAEIRFQIENDTIIVSGFQSTWFLSCYLSWQARGYINDGFVDAINHYDDEQSSLDKAVDDLQKDVSVLTLRP